MGDKGDKTLTLLHLRKTFSEYNRMSLGGAKEIDPNRLLPLFKNVMSMYNPVELRSEFKEAPSFALFFASFLVREVRTRASTQGTEEAAVLIADYLLPCQGAHRGFSVLSTLQFLLLSIGDRDMNMVVLRDDDAVVDAMCKASLPSTIVKSLYLFFDLPLSDGTQDEPRRELNELLTSLMEKLCTFKCVSEELTKKDDLALLFIASSSSIRPENIAWRKTCSRCLETLASRALTPVVIKYISVKECIRSYLVNVEQCQLSGQEMAEMLIGLFAVLKDSSTSSVTLSDAFISAGGYDFLLNFIKQNESDGELVRSVLSMLITLITSGPQEIKPQISSGLVSLLTFEMPSPSGPGLSVRNTAPFAFLYRLFVESSDESTLLTIVDVVLSVYTCDAANYFILEREFPLSSFIEKSSTKNIAVKSKLLEVIEYLLFRLHYIPCKEMIALCVMCKTELSAGRAELAVAVAQSAFRLLTVDPLVKDAFREVGLLDTLCYCVFNIFNASKKRDLSEMEHKLTLLATDLITVTIKGNSDNARLFSDASGPRPLLDLLVGVNDSEWRSSGLQLLKQLLLLTTSDVYISALLAAINRTVLPSEMPLATELLKSLLGVLRESHKVRVLFRRAGGYACLLFLLLSLEGMLSSNEDLKDALEEENNEANTVPRHHAALLDFVNLIFKVLTISMRFEPSNAKFFSLEVNWESVSTVLRLTGAFSSNCELTEDDAPEAELKERLAACHAVFKMDDITQAGMLPSNMPQKIFYECYLIRLLFNMALDNYEKSATDVCWSSNGSLEEGFVSWTSSVLVHPGAVLCLLQLIPSIHAPDLKSFIAHYSRWRLATQLYTTLLVKALLRPERNQQLMCQVDMPRHLLSVASALFLLPNHVLLPHFYHLLERLSYQAMQPSQLRHFLRLDLPLCCRNLDETMGETPLRHSEGGPLPLARVKALVSMMTPRDQRLCHAPSFVEFDMIHEGFGCLFVPSLAPLLSTTRAERAFPPLNGITFSCWLYVDAFSDKKADAHPLRLLTVTRASSSPQRPQPHSHACLTLQISSIDRSLLISTDEYDNAGGDLEKEAKFTSDKVVRVPMVDTLREMEWHHICVILTRSVIKNSQVMVYMNGQCIFTQKMQYIVQNPGGGASQLAQTHAVNATIGTAPALRRPSRLRWRLASTFLLEEPMSAEVITRLYNLKPHYIGNLQTVAIDGGPLVNEEKIVLSLNGAAVEELTLSKIRGLHSKMDAEMTAGLLGLNAADNSTPLRILLNAASHASGPGRSFGGVIVGYLGMRTFAPRPVPRLLDSMGGYSCLFALVAMATDSEGVYASLKAIVSAVRSNSNLAEALSKNRAYQLLGVLLEDKGHLFNSHIVHLIFSLAGTLDTSREVASIPNPQAFDDLLVDVDVWRNAPDEMHRMLAEHFYELVTESVYRTISWDSFSSTLVQSPREVPHYSHPCYTGTNKNVFLACELLSVYGSVTPIVLYYSQQKGDNLTTIRSSNLLPRLLFQLFDRPYILWKTHDIVFNLLSAITRPPCDSKSLLKLGQAIAATLPATNNELLIESAMPISLEELQKELFSHPPSKGPPSLSYMLYLRNRLLKMLHTFISHSSPSASAALCDQIVRVLGFDWLLSLMPPNIHDGTLFFALQLLLQLLSHPHLLVKFREGQGNGGWLAEADSVARNSAATVLGFSVSAHGGAVGSHVDINPEGAHCAGFAALEHVLAEHAKRPHTYLAVFALLVGRPTRSLTRIEDFTVDSIWTEVFGLRPNGSVYDAILSTEFCFEALIPLFSMICAAIHPKIEEGDHAENWRTQYPCTVIQVVTFLYQNSSNFFSVAHSDEFVLMAFSSLCPDSTALGARDSTDGRETPSTPEAETIKHLTSSQASRSVVDLLKRILLDEMQTTFGKGDRFIDVLLETVSECTGVTRRLHQHTLSSLARVLLSDLLSTDLLVSTTLPPHVQPQAWPVMHSNMCYVCCRLADALWHSLLPPSDALKMMVYGWATCGLRLLTSLYLVHSISSSRGDATRPALDNLTHSIMRTVLFCLSRPIDSQSVQLCVLDTLSSLSNDAWFFASLAHLVFMLSVTPDIMASDGGELEHASAQVALSASRVWTDVLCSKKSLLEETFKRPSVSELNAARALLANAAGEHWRSFVEGQLAPAAPHKPALLQHQITQRITQVASGISRFASRRTLSTTSSTSVSKPEPWRVGSVSSEVVLLWLRVHTSLLRQLVVAQSTRYHEWHSHVRKWCLHEWATAESELTRERAIWGPDLASRLDKYKLDTTEGPGRMRRKMIPNRSFYHDYPYRPYLDDASAKALRAKVAISRDSKLYYEKQRRRRPKTIDEGIIESTCRMTSPGTEEPAAMIDLDKLKSSLMRRVAVREKEERLEKENSDAHKNEMAEEDADEEDANGKEFEEVARDEPTSNTSDRTAEENERRKQSESEKREKRGPDNQTLLRLLEQGEQLHSMFRCARIQGLETAEGLLLFGKECYYVVDGFTLLKTREIRDLDFLSAELHDPIVPYTATGATAPPRASRLCSQFSYAHIKEVHKRRYLLQPIALEVFSSDGRNYLLAFPKRMRDRVYEKLVSMSKGLTDGGHESVGGQKANMAMEQTGRSLILNSLIGQQSVTQRWLNGQISNFQYLMHLNTLAGRSYNDLSQYPVFPWVLADYTSTVLDLTKESTFRDFSRPMGAQSDDRLAQFLKRYEEWDDPTGETPPYMYGTHYSSAMIVVSYLVRLEPFTQQFLSLQGGHFDLADRMFHSVADAWASASRNNMADVKELIPEFFTLPEMFLNGNRFDLGTKQSGVSLDDVVLPPWAKDDPREFVRLHRMALESDYVSSHIHEWIDLVFGCKQSGEQAIQANNLFHHLFYEGNVDFESIDDPLTRNATIGFVNNFGQIPTQLFKKPHPQKKDCVGLEWKDVQVNTAPDVSYSSNPGVSTARLVYHSLHTLKPPPTPTKELRSAVGSLHQNDKGVICALEQVPLKQPQSFTSNRLFLGSNRYLAWGFPDRSIRIGNIDSDKSSCVLELNDTADLTCAACGDERSVFVGSSDGCVSVWSMEKKPVTRLTRKKTLDAHSDAVTCLVVCCAHNFVVSASRDRSAIVWHLSQHSLIRQLGLHPAPVSAVAVNDATGDIATACAMQMYLWSLNGDLLATTRTGDSAPSDTPHMIIAIAFSTMNEWDADNIIVAGSSDGVVSVFSCAVVENDGSLEKARLDVKKSASSLSTIHSRLDRQRRRLRVGGSDGSTITATSSTTHSPDPPSSPLPGLDPATSTTTSHDHFVRILVARASLTTHTAFARADNPHPAPITAILPSRCTQCEHRFSMADRKHHCRNCGHIFCAKCSRFESHITHMKISRPVRVCQACFVRLKAQNSN